MERSDQPKVKCRTVEGLQGLGFRVQGLELGSHQASEEDGPPQMTSDWLLGFPSSRASSGFGGFWLGFRV